MADEEKDKKHKNYDFDLGHVVLGVAIVILLVIVFMSYKSGHSVKVKLIASAEASQKLIDVEIKNFEDLKNTHELSVQTLKKKSAILDKIQRQMEGIKDQDDLLKRDIEIYIKATHRKVPSVVAKSIAVNIVTISKTYNISPELIVGIMKVESSFNPMIVGPKTKFGHARGLMQVMPEWVKKFKLKSRFELHDIKTNINIGSQVFLIHLKESKGDLSMALYKYVNKDKTYVGKVYAAMGKFVAFRSTIDKEDMNVKINIETNGKKGRSDKSDEKNHKKFK